jgi:trigger factor
MTHDHTHYAHNIKTSRNEERWELELRAEISAESLAQYRGAALKELAKEAHIDGFRPGKAPESMVLKHVGESALLQQAAEDAVKHELPELLAKEGANIVSAPQVVIEPPQEGKPVAFIARAPLAPEIKLPDYKKIAADINKTKSEQVVSDTEHAEALTHLRRERARIDKLEQGAPPQEAAEHAKGIAEADLPALDDEFAISLGYDSAKAFEDALRVNIKNEKDLREAEKRRASILDELVKKSTIKYPAILREYELEEMEARLAGDLERMGTTLEKFLADSKKTKEDLHKEWMPGAENRAKVRLILGEIARQESIEPHAEQLAEEVERAKQHYKDADASALRAHIQHAMRNEMVISWLEGQE